MIELRGTTWDHPRGLGGVAAVAEAYGRAHPDVRVSWEVRSLQAFADHPVERLAERYDLIVLDHPSVGEAATAGCLVPLDAHLDAGDLDEQRRSSVGPSAESYVWDEHVWALAIDAAAQIATYRTDLLERSDAAVPRTWDEVERLAERARRVGSWVAFPAIPVDAILAFLAICVAVGQEPCVGPEAVVGRDVGREAFGMMRRVVTASHPESTTWNPPTMLERMSTTDEVVYCPLAFGYLNYARDGFRPHVVHGAPGPAGRDGSPRGTLGGAGLAVSSLRPNVEHAVAFAASVAAPEMQRTAYVEGGGQPGHRTAWLDPAVNASCNSFLADTLPGLDAAYLRPRHAGFLAFQDAGGDLVHAWLRDGARADADDVLDALDERWRASRPVGAMRGSR